jgi:hypothetical protein
MSLEHRYRKLLHAYPVGYRAQREEEILGTYLELAGQNRRWPTARDAADVLAGSLRERLRANGTLGVIPGLRVAATVALSMVAGLSAWWLLTMRAPAIPASAAAALRASAAAVLGGGGHPPVPELAPSLGPFATLGAVPDAAWILTALVAACTAGRLARVLIACSLVLTVAVVPVGAVTAYVAPPLPILIPQFALGVLALALPSSRPPWVRAAPLAIAVAAVAAVAAGLLPQGTAWEAGGPAGLLQPLAFALVTGTFLGGLAYRARRDSTGLWAALLLLTPAALVYLLPHDYPTGGYQLWQVTTRAGVVTVLGGLLVALAVKVAGRRAPGSCPACGQPLPGTGPAIHGAAPGQADPPVELGSAH